MKPSKLTFTPWTRGPQEFRFVGWRGDRTRPALYLLDDANERWVMPLTFAGLPQQVSDGAIPVAVTKARLIPPPCFATAEEARVASSYASSPANFGKDFLSYAFECGLSRFDVPDPWMIAYGEALAPAARSSRALQSAIQRHHAESKKLYAARAATLGELPADHARLIREFQFTRRAPDDQCARVWIWEATVADMHQAGGTFRAELERALIEDWAKTNSFNLTEMQSIAEHFINLNVRAARNVTATNSMVPVRRSEAEQATRMALARVRFAMTFAADTIPHQVWLDDCSLVPPTAADEITEFELLLSTNHSEWQRLTLETAAELLECSPRTLKTYCQQADPPRDWRTLTKADIPLLKAVRAVAKAKQATGIRGHNSRRRQDF